MIAPRTHLYDPVRKRFINPHLQEDKRTLKDVLLWKLGYFDQKGESTLVPEGFLPFHREGPLYATLPKATWINHSTFFIQVYDTHLLTDPIWGKRCSPIPFLGPIRRHMPPLQLEELQRVDHVLISHNHYDHLDKYTVLRLHALYPQIHWWVPLGIKKWFTRLGIPNVSEQGWWESIQFSSPKSSCQIEFTAVPAQHFSGRRPSDLCSTLWSGWVVTFQHKEQCKRLYFVGDTGYNPFDFTQIGATWSHMDLSLIPIGSYVPRKFMSPVHIDPAQAVQIHKDVRSKQSLGMHWRTFKLSDEALFSPPYDLLLALQKKQIAPQEFLALLPGHAINW